MTSPQVEPPSGAADVDLRLLRYFVAVAETASFTEAAARMFVSQPALSQAMAKLERLVGVSLLDRGPRGSSHALTLTASGEVLLASARKILQQVDRAVRRARAAADPRALRVGIGSSTPRHLTRLLLRTAEESGGLEIALEHIPRGEELDRLRRRDVDLVFRQGPSDDRHPQLRAVALQSVSRMAVFHSGHRFARRQSVTMDELDDEPIVDAATERAYWLVDPRPSGRHPTAVGLPARNVDEMLSMVSAGVGMAITSSTVAAANEGGTDIAFVPISDIGQLRIFLCRHRVDRRPEVADLMDRTARAARATPQTVERNSATSPAAMR